METNKKKTYHICMDRPLVVKIISVAVCVAMLVGLPIAANSEQVRLAQHQHEMSEVIVTVEPDCETVGEGYRKCLYEGCTYQEPAEVEALGHQVDGEYCGRCCDYFSPAVEGLCETENGIFLVKDSRIQTDVTDYYTEDGQLWYIREGQAFDYYCGQVEFTWPTPDCGLITSYFGYRDQPTAGASTAHSGIDIGAMTGTTIVASAGGTVTEAGYNQWNGNYVYISHGDGLKTVYAHCSALYVHAGDEVAMGDKIAAVGSTGISTGSHLHFTIYLDGVAVDPLFYVSY